MKRALEFLIVCSLLLVTACQSVKAQGEAPILNVVYKVSPDQSYKLYGYITHAVDLQVNGTFEASAAIRRITILFTFTFDEMKNLPTGSNYTIGSYQLVPGLLESRIDVSLPPGRNGFEFDVIGTIYGDFSFVYRNSAHLPYVSVSTDTPPFAPTSFYLQIPENAYTQVFSITPSNLPMANVRTQGGSFLLINPSSVPGATITLQYQPPLRDYLVFLYLAGIGATMFVLPFLLRRNVSTFRIARLRKTLSRLGGVVSSLDSRRLFAAFVLLSVLMISLAFVFGPSPTPKVYVAATPDTSKLLAPYLAKAGYSYLTVHQAGDQFDTMAGLGSYSAAIVADYPPPLLSGLGSVLHIIAIRGFAPTQYISELRTIYPDTLTVVASPTDLYTALSAIQPRANPLGLSPGHSVYTFTVALEGLLSLILPFVGMAFLSRTLIESKSGIIVGMGEAMGFSFFCFMFGQLVFMASTLYLGLPVALHAAVGNSETAVGLFGFGGGTRPRELTASVGILFGLVSGKAGKFRIDRLALLGLISVTLFLLMDPLNVGSSFYDSVLAQTTSVGVGSGVSSVGAVRSLIGSAMDFFGSGYNVSLAYFAQHGASLFYLGAVPLALYSRVRKSTATLLAISVSFISGFGFVRIADMFPTKAIASVIPGVVLGVGLAVIFLFLNAVEGTFRKRILESSA